MKPDTHTTRYADALHDLTTSEGHRNGMLLGVASLGLLAGRSPVEVEADLLDAGAAGRAPLTPQEVRRAVQRAEADGYGSGSCQHPRRGSYQQASRGSYQQTRPKSYQQAEPPRPSAFMDTMTARGREYFERWREWRLSAGLREWETEADLSPLAALQAASPCPLDADTLPARMAALKVAALFDPGETLWAGELRDARSPSAVHAAGDFARDALGGRPLPSRILPNPVTGEAGPTKDGGMTFRGESTLSALRHCVIEFDAMDGEGDGCRQQSLFWLGATVSRDALGRMPLPVRCIVYSGNKSLHAVLRLDSADAEAFRDAWDALAEALPGLDPAFRSPAQCMRLAGAVRGADEKRAGVEQSLLWCVPPSANWTPFFHSTK